jgi:Arc/MetJ family transcription regulator
MERAAGGGVELRLGNEERALLMGLAAELQALLDGEPHDPSLRRLFPPAYDDESDERAYRELAGDSLLDGRREALELLSRTADRERLTAEEADGWLRALNDLRLVLGTRLDVQEDTFADDPDLSGPRGQALAVYGYLSWLQEQLVYALSPD